MNMADIPAILYHGGILRVDRIDLSRCQPGKDFGQGFYTTSSFEQAERFAKIKMRRHETNEAFVSVYECRAQNDLSVHRFAGPNPEWLDFVLFNRGFTGAGIPNPISHYHDGKPPDIIIGPVADDTVGLVLNLLTSGVYGDPATEAAKAFAITQLRTEKLFDQVFFATRQSLASLAFKEAVHVA